jgi:hypothetical protein
MKKNTQKMNLLALKGMALDPVANEPPRGKRA